MLKENLVNDMMKTIAESYNDSYTKLFTMGAIYVYALRGKIYKGDNIRLEGDAITSKENTTHEVTALLGNLAGTKLQIEVRDLITNESKTIDL